MAVVRHVWQETPRLTGVSLQVEPELVAQHTRPGQVIQVELPGAFPLAIASRPGESDGFELLLGPDARAPLNLTVGAQWPVSAPFGLGYPIEAAADRDVVIFGVGSAMASLRPLIDTLLRIQKHKRLRIHIGAHDQTDLPYQGHLQRWSEHAQVIPSYSRPWVWERFEADPWPLADATVFAAGSEAMLKDVERTVLAHGLAPQRFGLNW